MTLANKEFHILKVTAKYTYSHQIFITAILLDYMRTNI